MGFKRLVAGLLAPYPRLFFLAARMFAPKRYLGHLVGPGVELVVSGYPRSANSFAYMAFYEAQERDVPIAGHLHIAAEVREAVRLGLPTLVLIRRPQDAIRSLKAIEPGIDENRELERWIAYYAAIEPLREHFVVSDFERTTADFGSSIDDVNARFGTRFRRFETTEENRARVFARMKHDQESQGTQKFAGVPGDDRSLPREHELKFDRQLLERAATLYERFKALSGSARKAPAP